ncbi:MerR family transcriptional regulator [Cobetia crustatorum]|uniref:MerR family transcriptional regulator n=1 Tax=Cobetia crustatorum TaxID=553385 RepID=UPI0004BC92BA
MPTSSSLSIGDLALQADCKVQTIRYYEDIGLLPPPLRNAGNQRRYGDTTLGRLNFIRHARDFGFPVPAIRELLSLSDTPERPCEEIHAVARITSTKSRHACSVLRHSVKSCSECLATAMTDRSVIAESSRSSQTINSAKSTAVQRRRIRTNTARDLRHDAFELFGDNIDLSRQKPSL